MVTLAFSPAVVIVASENPTDKAVTGGGEAAAGARVLVLGLAAGEERAISIFLIEITAFFCLYEDCPNLSWANLGCSVKSATLLEPIGREQFLSCYRYILGYRMKRCHALVFNHFLQLQLSVPGLRGICSPTLLDCSHRDCFLFHALQITEF